MRHANAARSHEDAVPAAVDDGARDPFECFPEHILHHILSLLPSNKERARTTFVSKSWRDAYSSHPKLGFQSLMDFDVRDFLPVDLVYPIEDYRFVQTLEPDKLREINDQFLSFVDEAVARDCERSLRIQRLKICAMLVEIDHSRYLLDKSIGMALDNGVQELHLRFDKLCEGYSYSVPARVFSLASVKTLTLHGEEITTPLGSLTTTVHLASLQSLKFVRIPLDEPMLRKLLRGCPLLEELTLYGCEPLTQVVISGPNNLRVIALSGPVNRVEIEAPSLEELECINYTNGNPLPIQLALDCCPKMKRLKVWGYAFARRRFQGLLCKFPLLEILTIGRCQRFRKIKISNPLLEKIEIEECDGLVDIEIGSANHSCPRVKHLNLTRCEITQCRFHKLLSKLLLLESLTIKLCVCFEKIMISNPLLEKIEIEECDGLADIEIGSPNLSCFRYGTRNMELPFIRMSNPAAVSVCEANLSNDWESILEPTWFIKLREFLTRSCQFRSISFDFDLVVWEEGIVQDLSDALPLLPYDVDCLHLSVCTHWLSYAAILNMMVGLSHPTTLQVRPYGLGNGYRCDFLKFVCDKLEKRGDEDDVCCCCSGSDNRNCWLHELKGVEIEGVTVSGHRTGPLDWHTLRELLPNLCRAFDCVYFRLHWK